MNLVEKLRECQRWSDKLTAGTIYGVSADRIEELEKQVKELEDKVEEVRFIHEAVC